MALVDITIRNAHPKEKQYKLSAGKGLYLLDGFATAKPSTKIRSVSKINANYSQGTDSSESTLTSATRLAHEGKRGMRLQISGTL